ncbi:MAG: hypothetical protein HN742_33915 [Lentisphaerae bacterium]|jgi:hypothetical protein|nr:hypothetical protein [Lentisphaerota bacterium]MBT4815695.1 hypothetical protein [Lentisphaerota bacterium]MBT5611461.1 hypothetical protein [Lentisphaerota bacterium]MBT7061010.1 hypothetical protein [Lentisphaerota bacterium]MBT7846918.1 hypothetical protein [Lentisphaerota bacterium]
MEPIRVSRSESLAEAINAFLDDVGDWIHDAIESYGEEPATNCHDQGTYMTSWVPYLAARPSADVLSFMGRTRDRIRDHFVDTDAWHHGYWRHQEAHHGTEHFELFLGALWDAMPEDPETLAQLVDAAEHIGNWSDAVEPWFDWDTGLFRGMYFGADGIDVFPGSTVNLPDHIRCVNICLLAHRMTDEQRYLDLCMRHAGLWVDAFLELQDIPAGVGDRGPVIEFGDDARASYRAFAGQAPKGTAPVDRAENLLASGAPNTFLSLWQATGDERFLKAVRMMLDVLVGELADPDAGSAAALLRCYRRLTSDNQYDTAVLEALPQRSDAHAIRALAIDPHIKRSDRETGIGKRADKPNWFEDGNARRFNPITLSLAAEIAGDEDLAACGVDLARSYFALARRVYPDGRNHGCSAQTVSAIARGHGRENGSGVITAVLGPALGEEQSNTAALS